MYDFLIVGAGLFGATFARCLSDKGRRCLILDRRETVGGNASTRRERDIVIHEHGAHIFHTDSRDVYAFAERFAHLLPYVHRVTTLYRGREIPLPIHLGTFRALWGDLSEEEIRTRWEAQKVPCKDPKTVEELGLSLLGRDVYEAVIRGYTQKQWGVACSRLPASLLRRIPVRMNNDDRYFSDPYQGIPRDGYTAMTFEMLRSLPLKLGTDYLHSRDFWDGQARAILYTGALDELFGFDMGPLEYRTLRFESEWLETPQFQNRAVINCAEESVPYTRTIEHGHFQPCKREATLITREYPAKWTPGQEPYYPLSDEKNMALYSRYAARLPKRMLPGGRLGLYRYLDMDDAIAMAMKLAREVTQ